MPRRSRATLTMLIGWTVLIACCLMLSGCWDRKELQERHFVLAIGIDLAEAAKDKDSAKTNTETFVQPHGGKLYRLSLQLLDISPSGGKDKGKGKTYVLSNTGQSMFEMLRDMLGQSSHSLWFEHIQVLVISEAALKQGGLTPIIDFWSRDLEMRSRIKVFVTPGQARSILEWQPPNNEAGGLYLASSIHNNFKDNNMVSGKTSDLGYVLQALHHKKDIGLARIELADKVIKIGGAAALKKDQFVGYLDEYAVKGSRLVRGTEKSAIITFSCPEQPQDILVFELFQHDTKLTPHVQGDTIYFTLDISMVGNIGEMMQHYAESDKYNLADPACIRRLEGLAADEVKHNVLYAVQAERRLGTDFLGFDTKLKTEAPQTWDKVKDRWDDIFPTIPIEVSVNVTIRGSGERVE